MKNKNLKLSFYVFLLLPTFFQSNPINAEETQTIELLYFSGKTPYQDISRIKPKVVEECEIEKNILEGIKEKSAKNGLPITDQASPRTLSVEIIDATPGIFVFGNLGSVPATLDIAFKVTEGEKTLLEQTKHCQTNLAGFLGLQPSACNKIERCARNEGEYLSERVSRALYPNR